MYDEQCRHSRVYLKHKKSAAKIYFFDFKNYTEYKKHCNRILQSVFLLSYKTTLSNGVQLIGVCVYVYIQ